MAVVTTPGSASANSYASETEFKAYRDSRLPAITWAAAASDATIDVALIMAARVIDACFDWTGAAVDSVQALCWPRKGMLSRNKFAIGETTVPQQLKDAQCELALQLGNGDRVSDNDPVRKGITSIKAGSVGLTFKAPDEATTDAIDAIIRRLGSEFNYVSTEIPDEVRRLLVESWFNQPSILRPMIFKAN